MLERLKFTSQGEYDRLTRRLMAYYAEKAGIAEPGPKVGEGLADDAAPSAKYIVNIYGPAQGLVIGDETEVRQRFRQGADEAEDTAD